MATDRISGQDHASLMAVALAELERMVVGRSDRPVEQILSAYPALAKDPDSVLELIYTEHFLRLEGGESPSFESWADRFPDWQDELRKLFHVHELMGEDRPHSAGSTGPIGSLETWHSRQSEGDRPTWRIPDYELIERIGAGGMGTVYRARHLSLDRIVAVKTVASTTTPDGDTAARFEAEARSAARLRHPNIVQIYEVGTSQGIPYFAMEYVEGGNLGSLTRDRPLEPRHAAVLLERLAQAIHYAHGQMVIHRDLKPANILIQPVGDSSREWTWKSASASGASAELDYEPKIADFGLARLLDATTSHSLDATAVGTPSYMAPEQATGGPGSVGPACDIYGLGAILYDVLVARPPFAAPTVLETLKQVKEDDPVRPKELQPRIPLDLETICLCCLRKNPTERYASAQALADDLRRFLRGEPIRARTARPIERLTKWVRRYPLAAALLTTILVAAIGMGSQWVRAEQSRTAERASHQRSKRLVYAQEIQLAQRDYSASQMSQAQHRLARTRPEFRNWEYHYLTQQSREVQRTFRVAPVFAAAVDVSPDGSHVVCGSRDAWGLDAPGQLSVWNIHTGELVHDLHGHPGSIMAVNFSPCGKYLASGGVFWGSPPTTGGLCVWDAKTGQRILAVPDIEVHAARFSPDGSSLAVGLTQGSVQVYSIESGKKTHEFRGHRSFVCEIAFRPDGKCLVSAGRDGTLRAWSLDPASAHPSVYAFQATGDIRIVDWSSNGRDLLACSFNGSIRFLRQREDGTIVEIGRLDQELPVTDLRYSPDGQYIAMAGRSAPITILDATNRRIVARIQAHNAWGMSLAFDASGRILASGGADGTLQVRDLHDLFRANRQFNRLGADAKAVAVHPRQSHAALALGRNPRRPAAVSGKPRVRIVDLETDAIVRELAGNGHWLTCVAYSSDGLRVVAGSEEGTLVAWDAEQGTPQVSFQAHQGPVTGVAFVDEGKLIVSSGPDRLLKLWQSDSGVLVHQWQMIDGAVESLAVSDELIAATTSDRHVRFFHPRKREAWSSSRHGSGGLIAASFRPAGDVLAVAKSDGTIDLWSVPRDRSTKASRIRTLKGHTAQVDGIAFSPDGERLASGSRDRSIKWWDWRIGRELLGFTPRDGGGVNLLGISPDGRILKVWDQDQYLTWAIDSPSPGEALAVSVAAADPARDAATDPARHPAGDSQATIRQWHRNQLDRAKTSRNHHAQWFQLTRLMELEPERRLDHQFARGNVLMLQRRWDEARHDLLAVLADRDTAELRGDLARVALQLGRFDEYQVHCGQLGKIVQEKPSASRLNAWAWISALSPESYADWTTIRAAMESSLAGRSQAAHHNTLALVCFRDGDWDAARRHAEKGLELDPTGSIPFDWVVLALVHAGKGEPSQSRSYLAQVERWIDEQDRLSFSGLETARNYDAFAEPDLRCLLAEATSLLSPPDAIQPSSP